MNQYLIPTNTKRSMLILGFFAPIDLIIFAIGAVLTVILMVTVSASDFEEVMVVVGPIFISTILVLPVPNHRNVWQLCANVYIYFSNRRTYYWKGWCVFDEQEEHEETK